MILAAMVLAASIAVAEGDAVTAALNAFSKVQSYSVTLRSGAGDGPKEIIKYYFKRPGFVRMEFVSPYKGAVLVYDPLKKYVRLRPFGFLKPLVLTLSPENKLVKSARGHTVDESDIGALLRMVSALKDIGETKAEAEEEVSGRPADVVSVIGAVGKTVDGINKYLLWLDKKTRLPLRVSAYDAGGKLIEDVLMDDLDLDVELPEGFFGL